MAKKHAHLTVVGDDAQSIYSFRGANIRNILDLRQQIKGTKLFKLEQNYRSTQNIVDAANSLIAKNTEQIQKTIYSEKERGSLLKLTGCYSDLEESYQVTQKVAALHDEEDYNYRDCAILYRTNAQSRTLEESLRKKGIDYRIFGGLSFYQRAEIKDVIAMLRLVINPADEEAFKRVLKACPFGIGNTTMEKMAMAIAAATEQNEVLTYFDIAGNPDLYIAANSGTKSKLVLFQQTIVDCSEYSRYNNVYETVKELIRKFHYREVLDFDSTLEGKSKQENVQELVDSIQEAVIEHREAGNGELTITEYLSTISLDEPDPTKDDPERDYVALMTIHQAKGLEFKNVFIVGVEENLLPSDMSFDDPKGVEEERRLFYVAITRAEENCFLSYATSRFRNGKSEACRPSRFLKDIDQKFIQRTDKQSSILNYGSMGGGSFDDEMCGGFGGSGFGGNSGFGGGSGSASYGGGSGYGRSGLYGGQRSAATSSTYKPTHGNPSPLDFGSPRKVATREKALSDVSHLTYNGKNIEVGTVIMHERFGEGIIKGLSGNNEDARIVVFFNAIDENKTLLLKYAKFTVAD